MVIVGMGDVVASLATLVWIVLMNCRASTIALSKVIVQLVVAIANQDMVVLIVPNTLDVQTIVHIMEIA